MEALDGNAIAGLMFEHFGAEMTTVAGTCIHCGATKQIAELRVYNRAPGTVVRCPDCESVVIVLVRVRDTLRAHVSAFELRGMSGEPPLPDPA